MDKRENQPLQEELRSSQVYRTLKSSGIPMAGKLAEGLGKAAQGLDQALNLGKNGGPGPGGHPYQAPPPQGLGQGPTPARAPDGLGQDAADAAGGASGAAPGKRSTPEWGKAGQWLLPLYLYPGQARRAASLPAGKGPEGCGGAKGGSRAACGGQPSRCRPAGGGKPGAAGSLAGGACPPGRWAAAYENGA